jgi:hypothetical protein
MHFGSFLAYFIIFNWLATSQYAQGLSITLSLESPPSSGEYWPIRAEVAQLPNADSLSLFLRNAEIDSIVLKQGRLKNKLAFVYQNDHLTVPLAAAQLPLSTIVIFYQLHFPAIKESPFYQNLDPGFAINALNKTEKEAGFGLMGNFYPCPPEPHYLDLNLKLNRALAVAHNNDVTYEVKTPQGRAYYTEAKEKVTSQDFYLIVGNLEILSDEALEEQLAYTVAQQREQSALQIETQLGNYIDYLARETNWLPTTDELVSIDNNEKETNNLSGFFILEQSLPASMQNEHLLRQLATLQATKADTFYSSKLLYAFYRERIGEEWRAELLRTNFPQGLEPLYFYWSEYANLYMEEIGKDWTDSLSLPPDSISHTPEQAQIRVGQSLRTGRVRWPVSGHLAYRYRRDTLSLVLNEVDTSFSNWFNSELKIYTRDSSFTRSLSFHPQYQDTVLLPLPESPFNLRVEKDGFGLFNFTEDRPQAYDLFELSRAENLAVKQRALTKLLNTQNPNLLATVVSIALRSEEPLLQKKGLEQFSRLNPQGLKKVKGALDDLRQQNGNAELKALTEDVLRQFYP